MTFDSDAFLLACFQLLLPLLWAIIYLGSCRTLLAGSQGLRIRWPIALVALLLDAATITSMVLWSGGQVLLCGCPLMLVVVQLIMMYSFSSCPSHRSR